MKDELIIGTKDILKQRKKELKIKNSELEEITKETEKEEKSLMRKSSKAQTVIEERLLEDEDPEMAAAVLQVSQGDLSLANQRLQAAMSFYQRAVAELQAISGAISSPQQKQHTQRQQEGATT